MSAIRQSDFEEIVQADWNSSGVYKPATMYSDGNYYGHLTLKDIGSDTWCTLERDDTPPKSYKLRNKRIKVKKTLSDGEQIKVQKMYFRGMYLTLYYFFSILALKHCK